jgi:hypothetical protein
MAMQTVMATRGLNSTAGGPGFVNRNMRRRAHEWKVVYHSTTGFLLAGAGEGDYIQVYYARRASLA